MFKEILKLAFEDLGLQELKLRGFVEPREGVVEDMRVIKHERHYELKLSDETSIGFTIGDDITFGEYFLEICSNGVRRFYRQFRGGICARFPFTEETLKGIMKKEQIETFHISERDLDIAYFNTGLESDGLELHISNSDNHLVGYLNGHYFELFTTVNSEIRVYSFSD